MNRLRLQLLSLFLLAPLALAALVLAGCGSKKADDASKPDAAASSQNAQNAQSAAPAATSELPADVQDLASVSDAATAAASGSSDAVSPASPEAANRPAELSKDGSTVAATGEFVSPVSTNLAAKFQGRVARVMVDEGARVRRGQPIFALEDDYLKLDVKKAEADLARAKAASSDAERDFNRKKDLIAKGSVAQAAYDRSQSAFESAAAGVQSSQAALDTARQRLTDAVLRSPIDGVVAEKKTDVGEKLGDNSVAFVLMQTSPLKLRFHLAERYLGAVRAGQRVRAHVDPYPEKTFEGRVALVGGVVDPATRTVMVETEFPNRDGQLSPGLFARVEVDLSPKAPTGAKGGGK